MGCLVVHCSCPPGRTFTVPLKLSGEVLFSARVMLLPHDWRDGRGAVRASVAVTDEGGHEHALWSGTLRASDWADPRPARRLPAPGLQHRPAAQRSECRVRCETRPSRGRSGGSRRSRIRTRKRWRAVPPGPRTPPAPPRAFGGAADLGADAGPRPAARNARGGDRLRSGADIH